MAGEALSARSPANPYFRFARHTGVLMDISDKNRIIKLIGMLGSAFDGERANAAAMLSKMAEARKMTLNELLEAAHGATSKSGHTPPPPPPPPKPEPPPDTFTDIDQADDLLRMLGRIAERPDIAARVLTAWEIQFSTDVAGRYDRDYELSEKQLNVVQRILTKASRVFK